MSRLYSNKTLLFVNYLYIYTVCVCVCVCVCVEVKTNEISRLTAKTIILHLHEWKYYWLF